MGANNTVPINNNVEQITNRDGGGLLVYPSDGVTTGGQPSGVALGDNNTSNNGGVSVGSNNLAGTPAATGGFQGFAFGNYNAASGGYSSTIGLANLASGVAAMAYGVANTASGNTAVALGRQNSAVADFTIAVGNVAQATATNAIALGNSSTASGAQAIAIGGAGGTARSTVAAHAVGAASTAIGANAFAGGTNGVALGTNSLAAQADSTAIGSGAQATAVNSVALGAGNVASIARTSALGIGNTASGQDATAVGSANVATATDASAVGRLNQATGTGSVAVGQTNRATALFSNAVGSTNFANANFAQALGGANTVNGASSAAIGYANNVDGGFAVATGSGNVVNGANAGAFGNLSAVFGARSFAIGSGNVIGSTTSDAFALGNGVLLGADATGVDTASVTGAVGIGAGASVTVPGGVALGQGAVANVAAGITGRDFVTGAPSTSTAPAFVSTLAAVGIGNGGIATRQITGVAAGAADTDAVNVAQLQGVATVANNALQYDDPARIGVTLGGVGATAPVALHNVAAGTVALGSTDAVNGGQLATTNAQVAGNTTAIVNLSNGTAGPVQQSGTADRLTLVAPGATGAAPGNAQQLGNVAAGTAATDAVNLGQLQQVAGVAANGLQYDDPTRGSVTLNPGGSASTIRNVAAGSLAARSTEAVNGGQLAATNAAVAGNTAAIGDLDTRVTANTADIGALQAGVANGSVGLVRQTGGSPGTGQISVGAQTGGTSVSVAGTSGDRTISGVAAGTAATDAVNVGQLNTAVASATQGSIKYDDATRSSITLNQGGAATAVRNVAAGNVAAGSTDAVNGGQLYATNQQVAALANGQGGTIRGNSTPGAAAPQATGADAIAGGAGSVASGARAVALGAGASATGQNSVALGAGSTDGGVANVVSVGAPGAERQVTNVAAATRGTDAVNLDQLNRSTGDAVSAANARTDRLIANVTYDLGRLRRRIDSGDARNAALAGIPQAIEPGQGMIGFGMGGTGRYAAVAFGASKAFTDEHTIAKAGVSYAGYQDRVTWQVGIGYGF